jgi:pimeloyl-ACP methyl ester carboxylesterase
MRLLVAGWICMAAAACAHAQTPAPLDCRREAVRFDSGPFQIAGDLVAPRDGAPHPVIVYVWGAGPTNRQRHIERSPVVRTFLDRGYAVLLYDKPGSGGSTGQIESGRQFQQLAAILHDAIDLLKTRDDIDARAIGLYGSSQASYVMATALAHKLDVAFVIAWSCPMENSIEQGAYLVGCYVHCDGGAPELAAAARDAYRRRAMARDYADYRSAADALNAIPAVRDGLGWAGPVAAETDFTPADTTSESFFDPAAVFASLRIPWLALYAENDRQIDPVQGADVCRRIMARGNALSSVEVVPGADHNMILSPRGCMQDQRDDYQSIGGRTVSPVFLGALDRWLERLRSAR